MILTPITLPLTTSTLPHCPITFTNLLCVLTVSSLNPIQLTYLLCWSRNQKFDCRGRIAYHWFDITYVCHGNIVYLTEQIDFTSE